MAETYGWVGLVPGAGYLEADLELDAAPWVQHLQSGYRAVWSVAGLERGRLGDPMSGPVILLDEDRVAIAPGGTSRVAIHPLNPSLWRGIAPGTELVMRARGGRRLGHATIRRLVGDAPWAHSVD